MLAITGLVFSLVVRIQETDLFNIQCRPHSLERHVVCIE